MGSVDGGLGFNMKQLDRDAAAGAYWVRRAWLGLAMMVLVACSALPIGLVGDPTGVGASAPDTAASAPAVANPFPDRVAADLRTRNALYKASSFSDLPGWLRDDLLSAQDALQGSCRVLATREAWRPLCAKAALLPRTTADLRNFFEREFAVFRVLNTDASRDGLVSGYYEPLVNGSVQPEGAFTVPVYATPNDLYTLDWSTIAPEKRQGTVFVAKKGRQLSVLSARQRGSYALETSRFVFDPRERLWRVQLLGERAVPYPTRAAIASGMRLNAQVLAYVDDPVVLYAMQQQGAGRIRLSSGAVLRVQYAEHNGQPFRPLRVVSKTSPGPRGRATADTVDTFELTEAADDWAPPLPAPALIPLPKSLPASASPAPPATRVTAKNGPSATDAVMGQLLGKPPGVVGPKAATPTASEPALPALTPDGKSTASAAVMSQLLGGSTNVVPPPTPRKPAVSDVSPLAALSAAGNATPQRALPKRPLSLRNDPSYVFFKLASDPSSARGPEGTLGIALTPGRSVAADPRVVPLGYPAFISSAAMPAGSALGLQRLVLAQDTQGAVQGAVRANFFWGLGAEVGRQATRTRQRGQMWLMLPHAEADKMRGKGLFTGSVPTGEKPGREEAECLIADDTYCLER
jgi:membrane-bound lytic murein transglycosylase A